MGRQKRRPLEGFHEVGLVEAIVVGEDGNSTRQLVEVPYAVFADSDLGELLGYDAQPILDEHNLLALAPEVASRYSCKLRDRSRPAEDGSDDKVLEIETSLQLRRWELDAAKARRARLDETYATEPEKLKNRGIASLELLLKRGDVRLDPLEMVEAEIVNLNDAIRQLEERLRDTLNEAAQLNARAYTMAPQVIVPVEQRSGERPTARRPKSSN